MWGSQVRMQPGSRAQAAGAGGDSPLSSQVIRGTGVPCTEHCSTKSWPSTTVQSFRTLENEGAASITASPVKAENRQAISDHSWPVLLTDRRLAPHCPGRPGLASLVAWLCLTHHHTGKQAAPLRQRPGAWGRVTGRGFCTVTRHPRSGSAQDEAGLLSSGTQVPPHSPSCLDFHYPGASAELLLPPFLVLFYFLVSFIVFDVSHQTTHTFFSFLKILGRNVSLDWKCG